MSHQLVATLTIRRKGADYRIGVTPAGVVWVERQRPAAPDSALQLLPLRAGAIWADDVWNLEAIGEAIEQYVTTMAQDELSGQVKGKPASQATSIDYDGSTRPARESLNAYSAGEPGEAEQWAAHAERLLSVIREHQKLTGEGPDTYWLKLAGEALNRHARGHDAPGVSEWIGIVSALVRETQELARAARR